MPLLLLILSAAWLLSSASAKPAPPSAGALEPPRDPGDQRPADPAGGQLRPIDVDDPVRKYPQPCPGSPGGREGLAPCEPLAVTGTRRVLRRYRSLRDLE